MDDYCVITSIDGGYLGPKSFFTAAQNLNFNMLEVGAIGHAYVYKREMAEKLTEFINAHSKQKFVIEGVDQELAGILREHKESDVLIRAWLGASELSDPMRDTLSCIRDRLAEINSSQNRIKHEEVASWATIVGWAEYMFECHGVDIDFDEPVLSEEYLDLACIVEESDLDVFCKELFSLGLKILAFEVGIELDRNGNVIHEEPFENVLIRLLAREGVDLFER